MSANNQNNGGNGYHPKRSVNHRNQHHQHQQQQYYGQGYISPDYTGAGYPPYGTPAYYNATSGVQYFPQGYIAQPTAYRTDYVHQPQHHQINLTTPTGEKVDIKSLHQSPNLTNASLKKTSVSSTPKASITQLHQRTPSISSTTSAPATPKKESQAAIDMREAFKKQVLARAKAAKESKKAEESKDVTKVPAEVNEKDQKPKEKENEAKEESKAETKAEVKEEPKEEPKEAPKEERVKVEARDVTPEVEENKEAKEELKEELKKEPKKEAEPTKVEEEKQVESEEAKPEEVKPEPTKTKEVVKDTKEQTIENSIKEEPEVEDSKTVTISEFFKQIGQAKPIEEPFNFKYPKGFTGPSQDLEKENAAKYRYDSDFLLQFTSVVKFPSDDEFKQRLKFIEANLSEGPGSSRGGFRNFGQGSIGGIQGSGFSKSSSNRKFDLNSRSNSRQSSKRKGGLGRDRKSNRNRERDAENNEPQEPKEPPKPLEKSATRWIPKSRSKPAEEVKYAPDGVTVLLSSDEIERKVRSLLNKLTLEYFDPITDDIIQIASQSIWEEHGETLKHVLNITFDKATDEPHWSSMYAQFCAKLCKEITSEVSDDALKDREGKPLSGGALVRKYLLSKCQLEYEKGWADDLPTNEDGSPLEPEMMTDEYYKIAKAKRRGLGLVRLIGHLYVLGLLSESIILICLWRLINSENPTDEEVENLIQLVKTVGQRLDNSGNELTTNKLNIVFAKMSEFAENKKISSRLQFSLLDLIDLRQAKWRGGEAEKGPKTITEIHQEEEKKHLEQQQKSRDRSRKGDSRQNSSWGSNRVNESDLKKIAHVASFSNSNQSPLNNFMRSKSSTSKTTTSNSSEQTASLSAREGSKNQFAALSGEGDEHEEHEEHEEEEPKQVEQQKEETKIENEEDSKPEDSK